jgi:putative endonuclease
VSPASRGEPRRGGAAERAVAELLTARGFQIVALNLRLSYLELDVVARRGDLVVVVEVRSRASASWTSGFGSIDGRKRYRVRLAGQRLWSRRYRGDPSVNRLRFDAASVVFGPEGPRVEYVEAAF